MKTVYSIGSDTLISIIRNLTIQYIDELDNTEHQFEANHKFLQINNILQHYIRYQIIHLQN